jgi:phage terminase large subunit-like protein
MPVAHTTRLPIGAKYSEKRAERAVRFIEKATVHTKSSWAGKPFNLDPWQEGSARRDESGLWVMDGIVRPLFGTVRYSTMHQRWVRQFTLAWIELARKQGKSELVAALGLYLLIACGEPGAEIYGAASDKDQASMVFNVARDMVQLSPVLSRMQKRGEIKVVDSTKRIIHVPSRSFYRVIAADAAGNLGANPYAVLFDEVLAQPDEKLWDAMRQGFGTRAESLLIGITTAGWSRETFAFNEHTFGLQVAENPDMQPTRFVYIAHVDEGTDWKDESRWHEAMPGLGSFFDIQTVRDEVTELENKGDLSQIDNFKIFRLNMWGTGKKRWLDLAVWDESEDTAGWPEELEGIPAIGGLDLAETTDLACWLLLFRTADRTFVLPRFFITRKAIDLKHKRMKRQFLQWEQDGLLTVFETDVHDIDAIEARIMSDLDTYHVQAIGYDGWNAVSVASHVETRTSVPMVKVPQSTTRMNSGSKALTSAMGLRQLSTNHNPLMRWMADNVAYKQDSELNIKPDKAASTDSIDGISALVNALCVAEGMPELVEANLFVFDGDEDTEDDEWN